MKARAMNLYKAPFRYDSWGGYIWDASKNMVADNHHMPEESALRIRGWGRISYLENPEALQDQMGEMIAEALTAYWGQRLETPTPTVALLEGTLEAWVSANEYCTDNGIKGDDNTINLLINEHALVKTEQEHLKGLYLMLRSALVEVQKADTLGIAQETAGTAVESAESIRRHLTEMRADVEGPI